jgi:hypothetical protein
MHSRLENDRQMKRPPPLSHRIFVTLCVISYRTALFIIFAVEILVTLLLLFVTIVHGLFATFHDYGYNDRQTSNAYRTVLLICLSVGQIWAVYQLRQALKLWDGPSRLTPYIAVATMETAVLNGYLWTMSFGFHNEFVMMPFYAFTINTLFRGMLVSIVIAVRWNMRELSCGRGPDDDQGSDTWSQQVAIPDNADLIQPEDDLIMDQPHIV